MPRNKIDADEPPLSGSRASTQIHRTLDSLPTPASGGGR